MNRQGKLRLVAGIVSAPVWLPLVVLAALVFLPVALLLLPGYAFTGKWDSGSEGSID